jgi:CSLREA domain-containing protein
MLTLSGGDDVLDALGRGVIIDAVNVEPARAPFRCLKVQSIQNVVRGLQMTDCLIGIEVEGNTNGIHSNVVYDNINGISLLGNANELNANKVGTNAAGTAVNTAGGNDTGIVVVGDNNELGTETANTISGNLSGVDIQETANLTTLRLNFIGTDTTGLVDLGNFHGVVVSGTNSVIGEAGGFDTENIISGNDGAGILMFGPGTGNAILSNFIGLAADGTALGNGGDGIDIEGSPGNCIGGFFTGAVCTVGPGTLNFISANGGSGINIEDEQATGNKIFGNWIGLDATDGQPAGNADAGITIEADNTQVGEQLAGYGNIIAHNGGPGIRVISGSQNWFEDNEIQSNAGLGIDLNDDGVTPNDMDDVDSGPNGLQNYPVLTSATSVTGSTTIVGTFNSTPNTDFYFQFFSSLSCDLSGFGEGQTLIASGTVSGTTDANGDLAINAVIPVSVPGLRYITALAATDANPSTSEFSNCVQVPPIVVNSNADPGDGTCTLANCTLREALTAANADPGFSVIHFGIGNGTQTINLTTPLPGLTTQMWINGRTQPGYTGSPIIELNGAGIVADSQGLTMSAHGNLIEGLVINRFNEFGLVINSQTNVIKNNYIGTDVTGTIDRGNRLGGIFIGHPNNHIGGNTASDRNVISGNDDHGIVVLGTTVVNTRISGNYIGTNAAGTAALGNTGAGVRIFGGPDSNTIGGTTVGERNVISGNSEQGVSIDSVGTNGNVVAGNYIGTNAAGTADISSDQDGVSISGGATGNLVGGGAAGAGNVISGNAHGVVITGGTSDNNSIQGNLIGTNAAGTGALGNEAGVSIFDASGTLVGGLVAGVRNVISANTAVGVQIQNIGATGNFIRGNYIGTDITGMLALGNVNRGVLVVGGDSNTIGGSTPADTNVIAATLPGSANGHGLVLNSDDNFVFRNLIGVGADGVKPLGNAADGIQIPGTSGNDIGGSAATANTVAFNGGVGVRISSLAMGNNTGNAVRFNSIHANGGMGIDLGAAGIDSNDDNDPDQGANGLQNYPLVDSISVIQPPGPPASGTYLSGAIDSVPNSTFSIDFYQTYGCDASGHGEGAVYLGTVSGVNTGVNGAAVYNFYTPQLVPPASFISTIAVDAGGSSSEFSLCRPAFSDLDDDDDGYSDVNESERPLCAGNVNDDSTDDALVNDGCLSWIVAESGGACADAIDNDGDGFVNDGCPTSGSFSEGVFKIGTNDKDSCGTDAWPSDVFGTGLSANKLTIQDVVSFVNPTRHLDKNPGEAGFDSRWDLVPGKGILGKFININDITALVNGTTGNPPMFNNTRAFDKTCPYPP